MKIFDIKFISATIITLLLLVCVFVTNQDHKSYALTNLNVPEITNFAKSPIEDGALKVDLKSNNTGTNYSYELVNLEENQVNVLSGNATSYTYQNLDEGLHKIQVRVCTNDKKNYSCSNYSPQKSFELKEEDSEPEGEPETEEPEDDYSDVEDEPTSVVAVKLSTTSYVYNGSVKTPAVTVVESGETLTKNVDYKVTYPSGRKNIGTYTVTVTGMGSYKFTIKLSFVINPPATSINSKTAKKTSIKVVVNAKKGGVNYQIGYKKNSASSYKTVNSSSTTKTISSLTKNTKYNLKVRTYKKVGSKTYYSAWSGASSITTKKK